METIEQELMGWPGIETGYTGRGGRNFSYGKVQLGHLRGDSFADLPSPKKVRDVIELLRMNYERAARKYRDAPEKDNAIRG